MQAAAPLDLPTLRLLIYHAFIRAEADPHPACVHKVIEYVHAPLERIRQDLLKTHLPALWRKETWARRDMQFYVAAYVNTADNRHKVVKHIATMPYSELRKISTGTWFKKHPLCLAYRMQSMHEVTIGDLSLCIGFRDNKLYRLVLSERARLRWLADRVVA